MILGDVCTRNCGYCAVEHGRPVWEDREEPERVGRAAEELGLEYVVITSVNRDDLADGGAAHFAATVRAVRRHAPGCRIELLIPDFQGNAAALNSVIDAAPDVLNHNVETVPRLYKLARHGGRYERTLELFDRARAAAPALLTKSGIILGLGEEHEELLATMEDLRGVGVRLLTLGQYLRPSPEASADRALLPPRGVRRAGGGGARHGIRPRRGWPARALVVPRQAPVRAGHEAASR